MRLASGNPKERTRDNCAFDSLATASSAKGTHPRGKDMDDDESSARHAMAAGDTGLPSEIGPCVQVRYSSSADGG